jgi:hypothetical protein
MTIRLADLSIEAADDSWLRAPEDGVSIIHDETHRLNLLSVVRHIMRERGDCRFIPVVVGAVLHETNQWGHNAQIEVQYTPRWRAIYGAHFGERVTRVQCYMD